MSNWNPKPLRATGGTLFPMVEQETVVKGLSPMQRQRHADGTPPTRGSRTSLRPADPKLYVGDDMSKAHCPADEDPGHAKPKVDPDPSSVVKAFLNKPAPDEDADEDAEDEKKGFSESMKSGAKVGQRVASIVTQPARRVAGIASSGR